MASTDQPKARPVQLQVNNSGAWKTICRFDAGDIEACGAATQGALLRFHLDLLGELLSLSGKPVKVFGFSKSGDPLHPQMLGYKTPLTDWSRP